MTLREIQAYNNRKPVEFVIRENFRLIEDQAYISLNVIICYKYI